MYNYNYKLYDTRVKPMVFIMNVESSSPEQAIKKAGFDWIREAGGSIVKSRHGRGFTNSIISVYLPETVSAKGTADFILFRQ